MAAELDTRIDLYTRAAEDTASGIIRLYSTSFGLASRLLEPQSRRHIENIYSLVRLADEVVDGVASEAGVADAEARELLDRLEADTQRALETGYSTNLIVHAFAHSARQLDIGMDLVAPFFASMRADFDKAEHNPESFERYVYGSAEVVGLMCLQAFLVGHPVSEIDKDTMVRGARALGAAFQKVNFLRDLAVDFEALGRSYFPGVTPDSLDEETKNRLLDDIDNDLALSARALPLLPSRPRRAVALAHALFDELGRQIRRTPAELVMTSRASVPSWKKFTLALWVVAGGVPGAPSRATNA
ncbi:MAG: phytoene/squalene synthase family protein [Pontimonas sp.]